MAYVDASWKDLEPTKGTYDFSRWETTTWNTSLAKDKKLVLRVYVDYPNRPSGIPYWLLSEGVKTHAYSDYGGGNSPDYADPLLQSGLLRLVAALGKRYNSDPRVAYIELGLLGFWGEWHTYPHPQMFASEEFQTKLIDAYHAAFPNKPLMARNPSYASCKRPWLGFHDDMIPDDTTGPEAWKLLPSMDAAGLSANWKVAPVGGEMVPGAAQKYLGESWDDLTEAVKKGHMTWIGPYSPPMVANPSRQFVERQQALVRLLGYQFRLTNFKGLKSVPKGGTESLELKGTNEGVAPFYSRWPLQIALIDSADRIVETEATPDDIRSWLPGDFSVQFSFPVKAAPGIYRVAVGIVDPSTGKSAVEFANTAPRIAGYTVVGSIKIRE